MKKLAIIMMIILALSLDYITYSYSFSLNLQSASESINLSNKTFYVISNKKFTLLANGIDEININLTSNKLYVIYYIYNNSILLIMSSPNIFIKIINISYYNDDGGELAKLYIITNLTNLCLRNVIVNNYTVSNIPGINETSHIFMLENKSTIEINMLNSLNNILSFSQTSWTSFQYEGNNRFIFITFGIIPNSTSSISNETNIIILNSSTNNFIINKSNKHNYNIIYYTFLILSVLTLATALVAKYVNR
ncbi:MAG: hypothetical protein ACP5I6_04070 [Caldisphaera sp.]|jgi:hypothetical protein|nr:MAG: hypothetical protein C0201_00365 [Caldisphaera sp.]